MTGASLHLMHAAWVAALAAGCARVAGEPLPAPTAEVRAGVDFTLAPNDSARVAAPAPGTIRLLRVAEDGRCPREVTCAASGPVAVEVELAAWGGGATGRARVERLAVLDRDVGEPRFPGLRSCASLGALVLRLRDVQPWPVGRKPVPPDRYRATFVLGPSCEPPAR